MQTLNNEYYVYLHSFANGKKYIGKGKDSRSTDFTQRSEYWRRNYCKYGEPEVAIICGELDECTAFELEEFCISEAIDAGYKLGDTLINFTTGGEGISGYTHTDQAKEQISKASVELWKDEEYRKNMVNSQIKFWASDEGKIKKSNATKRLWQNETYRENHIKVLNDMWSDKVHQQKMSERMKGCKNPAARKANIYDYKTGKLIAENVVSAEWARENGYSRSKLQTTVKADRSQPSTKNNPHHHKGIYMEYVDGK